jgi:hypothetical protein
MTFRTTKWGNFVIPRVFPFSPIRPIRPIGQIGDGKGDRTEGAIPLAPGGLRSHPGSPAQGVSPYVAWSAPVSGPTRPWLSQIPL